MGADGQMLKYGIIKRENTCAGLDAIMGASEVIAQKSGRFVKNDGSGRLEIAVDGTTLLHGWIEISATDNYNSSGILTCSSTEGGTKALWYPIVGIQSAVFRIPVNAGTFVQAMVGQTCDLAVTSNIQGAKLDGSGEDTLYIVGGDLINNAWVDVMVNPEKIASFTGVV